MADKALYLIPEADYSNRCSYGEQIENQNHIHSHNGTQITSKRTIPYILGTNSHNTEQGYHNLPLIRKFGPPNLSYLRRETNVDSVDAFPPLFPM